MNERKWNDSKSNKANLVKGKFEPAEIKVLMNSLCSYAAQNDIDSDGLVNMCKLSAKDLSDQHKKAWCKIAECLPNRSV